MHLRECLSNLAEPVERVFRAWDSMASRVVAAVPRVERRALQSNRKLQPADIDGLVADYQSGVDLTALGERYGLHRQTAKAHLQRRGVEVRSERPALDDQQIARAVALYAKGYGLSPIASQFGVAPNTVKRALMAQGVVLRPRPAEMQVGSACRSWLSSPPNSVKRTDPG